MQFVTYNAPTQTICLNGSSSLAPLSAFANLTFVQLQKATTTLANFIAKGHIISVIKGDNIRVFDRADVLGLAWLITQKIRLDFEMIYMSSHAFREVIFTFGDLNSRGIKAIDLSWIGVSPIDPIPAEGLLQQVKEACYNIGLVPLIGI